MKKCCCLIILTLIFSILPISVSGSPVINYVFPEDGAKLDSNPILTINVSNDQPMNILWFFNESGQWKIIGHNKSVESGIFKQKIPNGTQEDTNYQWRINISDNSHYLNKTFWFRRMGWHIIWEGNFSFSAP